MSSLATIAPVRPGVRFTVAVPAHNEAATIAATIAGLAAQAEPARFDVIIFANNCTDRTAHIARAAGRRFPLVALHVVEADVPREQANAGATRRIVMDLAVRRLIDAGAYDAIVATTDADTVVDRTWSAHMIDDIDGNDAVAGSVDLFAHDVDAMPPGVRACYARELELRRVWTAFESRVDPRPEDPAPRHGAFVTANLAVRVHAYRSAGGMPPVAALEDRYFLAALRRIDARIRHSLRARAWTSARRSARVSGGFGTFIDSLYRTAEAGHAQLVEDPARTINEIAGRAALRVLWQGNGSESAAATALAEASSIFAVPAHRLRSEIDRSAPFGAVHERVVALARPSEAAYGLVPIEVAIDAFARASAARNALLPTRMITPSGAG